MCRLLSEGEGKKAHGIDAVFALYVLVAQTCIFLQDLTPLTEFLSAHDCCPLEPAYLACLWFVTVDDPMLAYRE